MHKYFRGVLYWSYNQFSVSDKNKYTFTLEELDAVIFHSPYCKLVQKSLARLALIDFLYESSPDFAEKHSGLEAFR